MERQLTCPHCQQQYQQENPPRLLISCGHSYCEQCIKLLIRERGEDQEVKSVETGDTPDAADTVKSTEKPKYYLKCPQDGEQCNVTEKAVTAFPMNKALFKLIQTKKQCSSFKDSSINVSKIAKNDDPLQEDEQTEDLITAINGGTQNIEPGLGSDDFNPDDSGPDRSQEGHIQSDEDEPMQQELCLLHQKPLEVVCMVDMEKICSKCAIFGEHKTHQFKSVDEIQQEYSAHYQAILAITDKKDQIGKRMANQETSSELLDILANKKAKLRRQIIDKFTRVREELERAQRDNIVRLEAICKDAQDKLKGLLKIDSKTQAQYNAWTNQSEEQLRVLEFGSFEEKLEIVFGKQSGRPGYLLLEQGASILNRVSYQEDSLIPKVDTLLENIGIIYNDTVFEHISAIVKVSSNNKSRSSHQKAQTIVPVTQIVQPKGSPRPSIAGMVEPSPNNFGDESLLEEDGDEIESVKNVKQSIVNMVSSTRQSVLPPRPSVSVLAPPPTIDVEQNIVVSRVNEARMMSPRNESAILPSMTNIKSRDSSFVAQKPPLDKQATKKRIKMLKLPDKYEKIIQQLIPDSLEILDLTNAQLGDNTIAQICQMIKGTRVRTLKLIRNKLTDNVILRLLPHLSSIITLNLSQNGLTQHCLDLVAAHREMLPTLKSLVLSQNKIIERKHKDKIQRLRKLDVNVSV